MIGLVITASSVVACAIGIEVTLRWADRRVEADAERRRAEHRPAPAGPHNPDARGPVP